MSCRLPLNTPSFPKAISLWAYGSLALPLAFAGLPLYIQAPAFYVSQQNISLSMMGLLLFGVRCFDAIQDPFFGWLYDRTQAKQRRIHFFAMIALAVGFYSLFHPATTSHVHLYFCMMMLLCTSGYSYMMVAYLADGARIPPHHSSPSQVSSTREGMLLVSILLASSCPSLVAYYFGTDQQWLLVTLLLIFLGVISQLIYQIKLDRRLLRPNQSQRLPLKAIMHIKHATEKKLLLVYWMSAFASAIPGVLVLFYIRDQLDLYNYYGLFLSLYFLSGAISMPFWNKLSQKTNPAFAWQASMALAIFSFLGAGFLGRGDFYPYVVICLCSGIAVGADLAMPPAILSHFLSHHPQLSSGQSLGRLSFCNKWAVTMASACSLPLLEVLGYVPNQLQSKDWLSALAVTYAIIPCCIKSIALCYLQKWKSFLSLIKP